MAEVRCPMCGKPNPSEAEVCQFCQARITPLAPTGSSNASPPPETSDPAYQGESPDSPAEPAGFDRDPEPGPDQPDWLRSLRQDGDSLSPQTSSEEDDLSDWLSDGPEIDFEGNPSSQEEADISNWLSEEPDAGLEGSLLSQEEADISNWPPEEPGAGLEDSVSSQEEADSSNWLSEEPDAGLEGSPLSQEEADISNWLSEEPGAGLEDSASSQEEADSSGWLPEEPDAGLEEIPSSQEEESSVDWLSGLRPGGEVEAQAASASEGSDPDRELSGETIPDWLPEPQDAPPAEEEQAGTVPPFTFNPEEGDRESQRGWLEGSSDWGAEQDGGSSVPAVEDPGSEPGLAPADLPSWLEAMRPVEAAAPIEPPEEEADPFVESGGPLTGLSGVLPAEPEFARLKKPSAYSVKLRVSENQQAHADIFEELIKAEGAVRPVPSRPMISSQHLLRLSIFFVLLLAIVWTMFTGGQAVSLPEAATETLAFSDAIGSLSPGSPVLLAVDYQPGLSAEMDALAASILDHLMLQETYLAIVSTSPTGPAQAERLLRIAGARGGQVQAGLQYANLGFIPGGPAGILGFAESPRRMMPFSIDGGYPWGSGSLGEVNRLDQFALAVVITEDPYAARAWIEQARPSLGDTPLLMALSAQAEPFVRPYYEGYPSQVQGILTGLAGAASYENLQARPGLARRYWDAYSFSLPLAAALILIGGAGYAGAAALADRRRSKAEASE